MKKIGFYLYALVSLAAVWVILYIWAPVLAVASSLLRRELVGQRENRIARMLFVAVTVLFLGRRLGWFGGEDYLLGNSLMPLVIKMVSALIIVTDIYDVHSSNGFLKKE